MIGSLGRDGRADELTFSSFVRCDHGSVNERPMRSPVVLTRLVQP
jgi:hypothetical protein